MRLLPILRMSSEIRPPGHSAALMPGGRAPGVRQAQTVLRTVCVRAHSPGAGLRPTPPPLLHSAACPAGL